MQALLCEAHGPPEDLRLREVAVPKPGRGQIRIRVRAAGLNFPDALLIQNKYQFKPPLPFSPGGEAAGEVDAVGEAVEDFTAGDRVAALTLHGAFAEYVIADANRTMRVPESMDLKTAGGFTLTYATAHHALKQRAALQPGETVLVLGAAGGVGLAAVEVAKALGAVVIGAASSEEKLALVRAHGADKTFNYEQSDLREAVKEATAGRGPDVIFDPVGDRFAEPAFRSIAWEGRYLVVGFAAGQVPAIPLNLPLLKGASIVGVFWGGFVSRNLDMHRRNMEELYAWHAQGRLEPVVSRAFPLERGGEAIRWMLDRHAVGKVIVTP
jgi:NADPH2:quinone reductase